MRKGNRTLAVIEYAFVVSMLATFSVLTVAGIFFGFQLNQWSEWQGSLVGVTATIAGVVGAVFGVRMALEEEPMNLRPRTTQLAGRHKTH